MSTAQSKEDVFSLLDSLGDAPEGTAPPAPEPGNVATTDTANNEKELLGFLDDLAKQPSRSQTPRSTAATGAPRSSRDLARSLSKKTGEKAAERAAREASPVTPKTLPTQQPETMSGGGWLGGLWSMGTAAMKTAEQKVKELQQSEEAKAWEETVRGNVSVLGKLGTVPGSVAILTFPGSDLRSRTMPTLSSTITSVLNTIAPPIEKHEGRIVKTFVLTCSLKSRDIS
jgi:Family of unknown function (DUF5427)